MTKSFRTKLKSHGERLRRNPDGSVCNRKTFVGRVSRWTQEETPGECLRLGTLVGCVFYEEVFHGMNMGGNDPRTPGEFLRLKILVRCFWNKESQME